MQRREISIFATFGGHLRFLRKNEKVPISRKRKSVNISKTITDTAISSTFLTRRVVQECPMQRGLAESGKWKNVNISKTVRDRAISSEFLIHRVVQQSPVQRGEISIFATFGGHLGFLRKMKKCQYLEYRKR